MPADAAKAPRVGVQHRGETREKTQATTGSGEISGDSTAPADTAGSPAALADLVQRMASLPPEALRALQAMVDALAPPRGA